MLKIVAPTAAEIVSVEVNINFGNENNSGHVETCTCLLENSFTVIISGSSLCDVISVHSTAEI